MPKQTQTAANADSGTQIRERAIALHALGLAVIPLYRVVGNAEKSKRPAIREWKPFQEQRPDLSKLNTWFNAAERNLAVVTGAVSGIVVVDTDSDDAEAWAKTHLPPSPWMVKTAKGWHRYYRHPGGNVRIGNQSRIRGITNRELLIDVRADGGYVVGPGSLHGSGAVYAPLNWPWATTDDVPTFDPAWLNSKLDEPTIPLTAANISHQTRMFLDAGASSGSRNGRLYAAACDCHGAGVAREEAEPALLAAAMKCSPPMDMDEARNSIASAYSQPRQPARRSRSAKPVRAHDDSPAEEGESDAEPETNGRNTIATRIAELILAEGVELWHSANHDAFISLPINGHREHHRLDSQAVALWARRLLFQRERRTAGTEAFNSAIALLSAMALAEGPQFEPAVRFAQSADGTLWLDLGLPDWSAVKITHDGWCIEAAPSQRFVRPSSLRPLPLPVRGGNLDELREFVNVREEEWPLLVGWLVAAYAPHGPYPILVINGEHRSAKSTTSRVLQQLIDPTNGNLRAEPANPRDLMIPATNCRLLAYDNISQLPPWLSDALCRISTGAGFATRTLHTNTEETIFQAQCPILLNGITEFVDRADLMDRTLRLMLPTLTTCQDDRDMRARFAATQPRILGAILDAVAMALKNFPTTTIDGGAIRMVDAARWVTAAEPALPIPPGSFLAACQAQSATAHDLVIDGSIVAPVLLDWLEKLPDGRWRGPAMQLLKELEHEAGETLRRRASWPKQANALSAHLRRIQPTLRSRGVTINFEHSGHGSTKRRCIYIIYQPVDSEPE